MRSILIPTNLTPFEPFECYRSMPDMVSDNPHQHSLNSLPSPKKHTIREINGQAHSERGNGSKEPLEGSSDGRHRQGFNLAWQGA